LQFFLITDKQKLDIDVFAQGLVRRAHDNLGTEVAAHCVKRNS